MTSAGQQTLLLVKPDQWGPLVSDWGCLVSMVGGAGQQTRQQVNTDVWGRSTSMSAWSKLTGGAHVVS